MRIFPILISLLINIYPPQIFAPESSSFICNEKPMKVKIYNTQNGVATLVKPKEEIDIGGFITINWEGLDLMLPRTFNSGETSFSDGKWWWGYKEKAEPLLRLRNSKGEIENFTCKAETK